MAVGRRQAWLFVTFGSPLPERAEPTLWIDTTFRVGDEEAAAISHGALTRLEPLVTAYVTDVALDGETLRLEFDTGFTLSVANEADARDSGVWWISRDPTV
jgi:hypothetical protein